MLISSAFPSKYLKAEDLQGRNVTVVIDRVEMDEVGKDKDIKPIVYFQGKEKGVVLNKTNSNAIAAAFGDDTDNWTGAEVVLFEVMTDFEGKTVAAIRIRVPPRKPQRAAAPPSTPKNAAPPPIDDDIQF